MQTSLKCPKCSCRKVFVIEKVRQSSGDARFQPVPVTSDMIKPEGSWLGKQVEAGFFEAWVCSQCGFTEWYAKEATEMLWEMAKRYNAPDQPSSSVRFIDGDAQTGPYR